MMEIDAPKTNIQEKDLLREIKNNLKRIVFVDVVTEKSTDTSALQQKNSKKWEVHYCYIYFYAEESGKPAFKIDILKKKETTEKLMKIKSLLQVESDSFINIFYLKPKYYKRYEPQKGNKEGHLFFANGMKHRISRDYKDALRLILKKQCKIDLYIPRKTRLRIPTGFVPYTYVTNFRNGIAFVLLNKQWQIISQTGQFITDSKFDEVFYIEPGFIRVRNGKSCGMINEQGAYITDSLSGFQAIGNRFSEGLIPFQRNNKWGFIDKQANTVIPGMFDQVRDFECGLSLVMSGNQQFIIDRSGRFILAFDLEVPPGCSLRQALAYRYRVKRFSHVVGKDTLRFWGLADFRLDFSIIERDEQNVISLEDGKSLVKKDKKWVMTDREDNPVVSFEFDEVESFMPDVNLARVKAGGKFGAIGKDGQIVIPLEFGYIEKFAAGLAFAVSVDMKKGGFIEPTGEVKIPFVFDANREPSVFEPLPDGGFITNVCFNGKYFWINSQGEGVLNTPPDYKSFWDGRFSNGRN